MSTYTNILDNHLHLREVAIFTIACYYEDYKLIDELLIKYKDNRDRWIDCVNVWGLQNACSSGNLNSIEYIVKNTQVDLNEPIYLMKSITKNNKLVLNYFSCINPYILFINSKDGYGTREFNYKDKGSIYLLDKFIKKVRIIQQWWKSILLNPHTKIGKQYALKQIEWAFAE
jgi:hypothetical protein